jgi:hypothetical protein
MQVQPEGQRYRLYQVCENIAFGKLVWPTLAV